MNVTDIAYSLIGCGGGVSKAAARLDEWAKTISPLAMLKRCCD